MKPDALGLGSYAVKDGKVLPVIMTGTLLPYNSCCPSITAICEWLRFDPFAPVIVIILKLFLGNFF